MKTIMNKLMDKFHTLSKEERIYVILVIIACLIAFPFGMAIRIYQDIRVDEYTIHIDQLDETQETTETVFNKEYHPYDIDYDGNHIIKVDGKNVGYNVTIQN